MSEGRILTGESRDRPSAGLLASSNLVPSAGEANLPWPVAQRYRVSVERLPTQRPDLLRRIIGWQARFAFTSRSMVAAEVAHGHGFLFLPVFMGAGAAVWFALPFDPPLKSIVFCLVVSSLCHWRCSPHRRLMRAALALGMSLLAGMICAQLETWRAATVMLDAPVTTMISGKVERREVDASGRWRYLVRVDDTRDPHLARPPSRVSLITRNAGAPLLPGDAVEGRVRLSPPSSPALPGLNDFAFSAYFDGIGAVGYFYGAPTSGQVLADKAGLPERIEQFLFGLRNDIGNRIRAAVPGDPGAFAAAIVTDERRAISKQTTEALRLAGLAHIVAISGLNMALAAGIFFIGLRTVLSLFPGFAQAMPIKKIAAAAALVMVTAYYLISGFGVSAERAYVMMAIILVAVLLDRPSLSLRNVALSALIVMALSPSEILGPSFQMSFAATVALISGYALWARRKSHGTLAALLPRHLVVTALRHCATFVAGIVATSMIGSTATAIYSVEHFHRFAAYGLAANLAAMPIISFIVMPSALIGMLLMPVGLDFPFLWAMGKGLAWVIAIAEHVSAWGGDVTIGRQPELFLPFATAGFLLLTLLRTRLRLAGIPLMVAAVVLSWQQSAAPPPDLVISDDGLTVALIHDGKVMATRAHQSSFIYDQWQRALRLPDSTPPVVLEGRRPETVLKPKAQQSISAPVAGDPHAASGAYSGPKGSSPPSRKRQDPLAPDQIEAARAAIASLHEARFSCLGNLWCAVRSTEGAVVVVVRDGRYAGAACDKGDIVIAPSVRFDACRSGALLLNGAALRRTGAIEISFNGSSLMENWSLKAASAANDRAWSRHRQYDWRSQTYSPDIPEPLASLLSGSGG